MWLLSYIKFSSGSFILNHCKEHHTLMANPNNCRSYTVTELFHSPDEPTSKERKSFIDICCDYVWRTAMSLSLVRFNVPLDT